MALIGKYAYDNCEAFKTFCSTGYYECQPTNKQPEIRYWRNNNRLINEYKEEYYEDCIGGKTGYTDKAGGTLVTYANINGRTLMCVVMKSANSLSAYADTTNLYDYVKEYVGQEVYDKFDEEYAKLSQSGEKETISSGNVSGTVDKVVLENDKDKDNANDGMWIGWKILILVVTVFIIYYVYVQYMRYQRRKRRRLMRMQRRREMEMQNRR